MLLIIFTSQPLKCNVSWSGSALSQRQASYSRSLCSIPLQACVHQFITQFKLGGKLTLKEEPFVSDILTYGHLPPAARTGALRSGGAGARAAGRQCAACLRDPEHLTREAAERRAGAVAQVVFDRLQLQRHRVLRQSGHRTKERINGCSDGCPAVRRLTVRHNMQPRLLEAPSVTRWTETSRSGERRNASPETAACVTRS